MINNLLLKAKNNICVNKFIFSDIERRYLKQTVFYAVRQKTCFTPNDKIFLAKLQILKHHSTKCINFSKIEQFEHSSFCQKQQTTPKVRS